VNIPLFFSSPLHCLRKTSAFSKLLQSSFNKPRLCDIGYRFPVAIRPVTHASVRWNKGKIEPEITKLFGLLIGELKKIERSINFYDVGANHGRYAWLISEANPDAAVIAFEPDPDNIELLHMTVSNSDLKNVRIEVVALSDKAGQVSFHKDSHTSATGMISNGEIPWVEKYLGHATSTIDVRRETLDFFVTEETKPHLIKIDVEGHENEVLRGGNNCLKNNTPLLIVESFPPKQEQAIEFLRDLGYSVWDAERNESVGTHTNNLFAWHPNGPLAEAKIRKILES
jgi:FkbM family methyltransferase